jgi:hypothetical protein
MIGCRHWLPIHDQVAIIVTSGAPASALAG